MGIKVYICGKFSILKHTDFFKIFLIIVFLLYVMEEKLKKIILEKINDAISNVEEIQDLSTSLEKLSTDTNSFSYGIVIGKLYNSFYYQCRRILKRSPTEQEFLEFLEIVKQKEKEIIEKLDLNKK